MLIFIYYDEIRYDFETFILHELIHERYDIRFSNQHRHMRSLSETYYCAIDI